ncbi:ABC transporter permease [Conexibacter woesei]|uniref:Binding-protein-dependent transport systems inner membrane component n=1 Tax=Conexibacter woesei (strain DSM 14684 / CCUG 47730 / CIP 108061 / JCM 11494 / NBRC 100937 / ID131577) TaxID=469383 RepID=D3FEW4_CONWI|nr:ABC transporter permease [Conexibacter woesei]ADB51681.1 binding-protein-dependent transport systems inner membrane component [Conexibacter woesei DSM 14684]
MNDFIDAFKFIGENTALLWELTLDHLALTAASMAIALVIAIPLGVWLGHLHRFSFAAINISNVGRALPSLAVISIGVALLGIGFVNVMVALVILAVPLMLTNAYVAVDGVDRDAVEAARGMGMTPTEVLLRVELPLALPLIFAGIRTAVVYVIATATLGSVAGASTLGDIIVDQATYRLPGVLGAAMCVAALALVAELLFAGLQRAVTPRGLRAARVPAAVGPTAAETL